MAVTWDARLEGLKTVGSLSDVVTTVHWTVNDVDGEHTGYCYGSVELAEADSSSFTAYNSITKDNAIAWAKDALGADEVTRIETSIAAQITESKTPTRFTGVPWS
tara:strand:- start:232 stop:546 length:315 start_codon:yes stop_codon:yes gene_type:complete